MITTRHDYEVAYGRALRWQEAKGEEIKRARDAELIQVSNCLSQVLDNLKRFTLGVETRSSARSLMASLITAQEFLTKAVLLQSRVISLEQLGPNPYIFDREPVQDGEEPPPVNMEAPEPENEPDVSYSPTGRLQAATEARVRGPIRCDLTVEAAPIELSRLQELAERAEEIVYGTDRVKECRLVFRHDTAEDADEGCAVPQGPSGWKVEVPE